MKNLKYAFTKEWYNIILLILPFMLIPFFYDQLPAKLPSHINLSGEIDGYMSKLWGVLFLPLLNVTVYLTLLYLPQIDPKKRVTIDQKPIPILRTVTILLLLLVQGWMILSGLEMAIATQDLLYLFLGIFFLITGNYMKTIKHNYFIGIRVPWTLESEENWRMTHSLGSYVWVIGGLLLIFLFPLLNSFQYTVAFNAVVFAIALVPIGFSFYLHINQKTEKNE